MSMSSAASFIASAASSAASLIASAASVASDISAAPALAASSAASAAISEAAPAASVNASIAFSSSDFPPHAANKAIAVTRIGRVAVACALHMDGQKRHRWESSGLRPAANLLCPRVYSRVFRSRPGTNRVRLAVSTRSIRYFFRKSQPDATEVNCTSVSKKIHPCIKTTFRGKPR